MKNSFLLLIAALLFSVNVNASSVTTTSLPSATTSSAMLAPATATLGEVQASVVAAPTAENNVKATANPAPAPKKAVSAKKESKLQKMVAKRMITKADPSQPMIPKLALTGIIIAAAGLAAIIIGIILFAAAVGTLSGGLAILGYLLYVLGGLALSAGLIIMIIGFVRG